MYAFSKKMNFERCENADATLEIFQVDPNSEIGSGKDKKSPGASSFSFRISNVGGLNSALLLELSASER